MLKNVYYALLFYNKLFLKTKQKFWSTATIAFIIK